MIDINKADFSGLLRKVCRVLDRQELDAVIKHPNSILIKDTISSSVLEDMKKELPKNCNFDITVERGMLLVKLKRDSRFDVVNNIKTTIKNPHTVCVGEKYVMLTIFGEHSLQMITSLSNDEVVDIRTTSNDGDTVSYTFLFK